MNEHPAVEPLDTDGVVPVAVGTIAWFVVFLAAVGFHTRLRHDGHLWWIAASAAGWLLGLLGIWYCIRRRDAIARDQSSRSDSSARSEAPPGSATSAT